MGRIRTKSQSKCIVEIKLAGIATVNELFLGAGYPQYIVEADPLIC
jgi:hypothetical protein